MYLSSAANKLFTNSLDLMPKDNYSLIRDIINKHDNPKKENKSFFACFSQQKKKNKIEFNFNFREELVDLRKGITDFNKKFEVILKDNSSANDYFDFTELLSVYNDENIELKIRQLMKKYGIENKLKDEVDKYAEYFNAMKIVEKQRRKIKAQGKKLMILEDAKMANDCIVCMENERNVVFYPCLHLICCEGCVKTLMAQSCLSCFQKIENRVTI
jgi:hypothetical protein